MKTEKKNFVREHNELRPLVLTSRRFRRNANLGMKVWRSATRNFDYDFEIEHVEIACPKYSLTDRGPTIDKQDDEAA